MFWVIERYLFVIRLYNLKRIYALIFFFQIFLKNGHNHSWLSQTRNKYSLDAVGNFDVI